MNLFDRAGLWFCMACLLNLVLPARAQPGSGALPQDLQPSTQEHIESESWWPTKSTLPLQAFAGSDSCTRCHEAESAGPASSMRRAATTAVAARFLQGMPPQVFISGSYTYRLAAGAGKIECAVSSGRQSSATRLDWVIGAGDLGRTFLYQSGGRWYQSRASFYTRPSALDITTGLSGGAAVSLPTALGQLLSSKDASSCFGCHTVHATTSAGLEPLHAEPGLGCEACHGPGRDHGAGMIRGNARAAGDSQVFNPARLSPSDSIDFCGACHRSSADAKLSSMVDTTTEVVRFQPYRLQESACWRETRDQRLTCVACHDPHKPLDRNLASYDAHCVSCHAAAAISSNQMHTVKVCPKATSNCVSCHMPKVAVASMHGEFTDHFIRVAKAGEPFPK